MSTETKTSKAEELFSPSHHTSSSRFEEVRSTTGHKKFVVPWVRNVLHGIDVLRNPKFNKGLAFTNEERIALRIEGLLPPVVVTQEEQVKRVLISCRAMNTDLDRYQYLMQLMQRNEKLFYRVVQENVVEMLPLVYTPTVGLACQKFGHVFKTPFGMYITAKDKGRIREILANWPERHVRASVFTDGERILGLGDLGTYGMGIPIGKMALYTACAGVDPRVCLPITLDVGTNNQALLKDPLYTGLRQPRIDRKEYDALIEEFLQAMMHRFGPTVLLQFEDFGNSNAFRLLEHYKDKCCTFNDDIQGTASVVLAGVLSALPLTGMKLKEHTFLFYGAGSAGIGIANLIAYAMTRDEGLSMDEARKRIWLVDSTGLVYKERKEGSLNDEKRPYAHSHAPVGKDLAEIVKALSPTAIFGVTAQPQTFTKDVIEAMAKASKRPLIFALSNPTSKAECTAEQAYTWTQGTALFASGSPFPPFKLGDKTHYPGQGNNSYIFPGVAHGVISTASRRVPDHLFFTAAKTLASLVTKEDLANGTLYPPMKDIRKWSLHIAAAVGEEIYKENLATVVPKPSNMHQFMQECMYDTEYPSYVH